MLCCIDHAVSDIYTCIDALNDVLYDAVHIQLYIGMRDGGTIRFQRNFKQANKHCGILCRTDFYVCQFGNISLF